MSMGERDETSEAGLRTVEIGGADLHYLEVGQEQGEPLILVHGSLGDYRSWARQLEALGARYRVVSYSRRYHYPNAWTDDGSGYSAFAHADDLAALIAALGLAPAHLVGSSYGAFTALCLALRRPELARSLVLGEPPVLAWLEHLPGGPPLFAAFLQDVWHAARAAFEAGEMERGVQRFLDGVTGAPLWEQLPPHARAQLLDNAPAMAAETASPIYYPPVSAADVRGIELPVLLLTGAHSPRMFHLVTDELERLLPNRERATIPNASHSIHTGNPAAYSAAVLEFLVRH